MQDSPSATQLLSAIADFLEQDIMPAHEGRTAFQVRIAISVCRILARESELEPRFLEEEYGLLAPLLGRAEAVPGPSALPASVREMAEELSRNIRRGDLRADSTRVFNAVEEVVRHKLLVVNPVYLDA